MFQVRYVDALGDTQTLTLLPGPTEVEYPEKRNMATRPTQDGAVVIQRPLRDPRSRKWVWRGYRNYIHPYETQWENLEQLEARYRQLHLLDPVVEIWEDESTIGGFDRMDGAEKVFTKVKFIRVERVPRPGGGLVVYDHSTIEFLIVDPSYTDF